jgi:hypothetical protein
MVISKTPLPFTNKGHSDKITQPAGDIADPNKPLYGKKPSSRNSRHRNRADRTGAILLSKTPSRRPATRKISATEAGRR